MPLELDVDWTIDLQGVVNRLIRTPLLNSGVDIFPVPSNEPRRMEEHEDWVAEVVIDVGDDIENHQQRPDQVVLDMV